MDRYLVKDLKKDLGKKILLLSGPRQSGKTTLSKMLSQKYDYLNYDYDENRNLIEKKEWDRKKPLLILDEIHKMPKWKSWLKGIYDVEGLSPSILVTGSAKMDTYRKVGDSLAGRYFSYRLYPFDLKELRLFDKSFDLQDSFKRLLLVGGFPEPFLDGKIENYNRWRRSHLDIILKQDLIALERVSSITGVENLVRMLRSRVGSTISHSNLAQDLGVDSKTVKNWLDILERLYVIFKITPFSKKIRESLLKAPKYYFYDNGQVEGDQGAKLENLVACALQKELHYLEDTTGCEAQLHFLRLKRGGEVDFLVCKNNKPSLMIEVKWSDDNISPSFNLFDRYFKGIKKIQLVGQIKREKTSALGVEVRSAAEWLSQLDFKRV